MGVHNPLMSLPIRGLYLVRSSNDVGSSLSVLCPGRDQRVNLEECARCPKIARVAIAHDGSAALRCRPVINETLANKCMFSVANLACIDTYCVPPEAPFDLLVLLFRTRALPAVPVVSSNGKAVGIITRDDVRCLAPASLAQEPVRESIVDLAEFRDQLPSHPSANEIMDTHVVELSEDTCPEHAAAVMVSENVPHVVLIDQNGGVSGLLQTYDLLRWLARKAGYAV